MEEKIDRGTASFISLIPFHVLVGVRKSLGILMCRVDLSRFHVADIQVNFIYKPAESQHATDPKSHLLLAD